jgi:hypothetical protein
MGGDLASSGVDTLRFGYVLLVPQHLQIGKPGDQSGGSNRKHERHSSQAPGRAMGAGLRHGHSPRADGGAGPQPGEL